MESLRAQHVSSETLLLQNSFGKFSRRHWQCERNARFTAVILKTFKFAATLIIGENSKGATRFSFKNTVGPGFVAANVLNGWQRLWQKDFLTIEVSSFQGWGDRVMGFKVCSSFGCAQHDKAMVRMKSNKSAHHKHLRRPRPVPFFVPFFERNPNPRTMQLSNHQKHCFWRIGWSKNTEHLTMAVRPTSETRVSLDFFLKGWSCEQIVRAIVAILQHATSVIVEG